MAKRLCNYCKGEVKPILVWYTHVDRSNPCRTKPEKHRGFGKVMTEQVLSKKETHVV